MAARRYRGRVDKPGLARRDFVIAHRAAAGRIVHRSVGNNGPQHEAVRSRRAFKMAADVRIYLVREIGGRSVKIPVEAKSVYAICRDGIGNGFRVMTIADPKRDSAQGFPPLGDR